MFFSSGIVEDIVSSMAATKTRSSSFSRNISVASTPQIPGLKCGPNGTIFVSSGIPDLDSNSPHNQSLYSRLYCFFPGVVTWVTCLASYLSRHMYFCRDFRRWVPFGKPSHGDGRHWSASSYAFVEEFHVSRIGSQPTSSLRKSIEWTKIFSWYVAESSIV